jgi:hypothetical protein
LREADEQLKKILTVQKIMNSEMQSMQERMDNVFALEETCRRQEVVIEKMEGQIRKLWNDRNGKNII